MLFFKGAFWPMTGILSFQMRNAKPAAQKGLRDLDYVETLEDTLAEGKPIPQGSRGTIVDWVEAAHMCEVEFVEPFPCVVTMEKSKLKRTDDASLHS